MNGSPPCPCRSSSIVQDCTSHCHEKSRQTECRDICPISVRLSPVRNAAYAVTLERDRSVNEQAGDFKAEPEMVQSLTKHVALLQPANAMEARPSCSCSEQAHRAYVDILLLFTDGTIQSIMLLCSTGGVLGRFDRQGLREARSRGPGKISTPGLRHATRQQAMPSIAIRARGQPRRLCKLSLEHDLEDFFWFLLVMNEKGKYRKKKARSQWIDVTRNRYSHQALMPIPPRSLQPSRFSRLQNTPVNEDRGLIGFAHILTENRQSFRLPFCDRNTGRRLLRMLCVRWVEYILQPVLRR